MSALCQKRTFRRLLDMLLLLLLPLPLPLAQAPARWRSGVSYGDSHRNFEEPMDGDHPCGLGTRYEHDDS